MDIDFDHVAFALHEPQWAIDLLASSLGATPLFGAAGRFRWTIVRAGDGASGMNVELLQPLPVPSSDFLSAFLSRRGDGPHHLTFKATDINAVLARLRSAGFEPIDVSLSNPRWQEAFLRPRDAHGTIVQVVQTDFRRPPMADMLRLAHAEGPLALTHLAIDEGEVWWEEPARSSPPVIVDGVTLATPSPRAAKDLYGRVLGGRLVAEDDDCVVLAWPTDIRLRFVKSTTASGIVALNCRAGVSPGAVTLAGVAFEVIGDDMVGVESEA